jgi:hypothetical protein
MIHCFGPSSKTQHSICFSGSTQLSTDGDGPSSPFTNSEKPKVILQGCKSDSLLYSVGIEGAAVVLHQFETLMRTKDQ